MNINAGWCKKTRFWRQNLVFLGKMAMLSVFMTNIFFKFEWVVQRLSTREKIIQGLGFWKYLDSRKFPAFRWASRENVDVLLAADKPRALILCQDALPLKSLFTFAFWFLNMAKKCKTSAESMVLVTTNRLRFVHLMPIYCGGKRRATCGPLNSMGDCIRGSVTKRLLYLRLPKRHSLFECSLKVMACFLKYDVSPTLTSHPS
jgi:hypothetical protein